MRIEVAGEDVLLLPDRALIWGNTALVADVHWGKSATLRSAGMPVPDGELDEDLARLARLDVARIVVLGDLMHAKVEPSVRERVAAWRRRHRVAMALVRGNHDRHEGELPEEWAIEDLGPRWESGPFVFRHEPEPTPGRYTWAGHVHPGVTLWGGGDALRLPCFHVGPELGVLPAFGRFTGSMRLPVGPKDRVFVPVEGEVVEVRSEGRRGRR